MKRTRTHIEKIKDLMHKASVSLDDADALEAVELFPKWAVGIVYEKGVRVRYEERLYKVLQSHTSQADWTPDITPSLYAEVEKPGEGDTPDNPIPYNNNMELVEGKYYKQYDVVYVCIRSTGVPVYNDLKDLVNIYVAIYEA
jgi:hypothetical protein